MRKYKAIIYILLVISIIACSNKDEDSIALHRIESSTIQQLSKIDYPLDELVVGQNNPKLFDIQWTPTLFYIGNSTTAVSVAPLSYQIHFDLKGANFENAETYSVTTNESIEVFLNDLNDFVKNRFNIAAGISQEIEIRIGTRFGEGNNNMNYSSNVQTITVTPF